MKKIFVLQFVLLTAVSVWAQRSPRDARDASPTGMRNERPSGKSSTTPRSTDWGKLAKLLETTPEKLSEDYQQSRNACDVGPETYAALRLAAKRDVLSGGKEPKDVLSEMCQKKTDSFSFALKAPVGSDETMLTSASAGNDNKEAAKALRKRSEKDLRNTVQKTLKEK